MRVSIERLRLWLLALAGLLVMVIAGFLGYAHVRAHRFLRDLPGRLGADITRESNGFTYSQSSKGRTVYTIHAAKMVQRKDGKTTLRDVGIVLYGQKQDRADRIYGSEFEYDQKAGVVRAVGEVHLDLEAPAPTDARGRAAYAAGHDVPGGQGGEHEDIDERMVHVKTSGLVFVQSLGVASTANEIEFHFHGLNGRAKGADYNSDTGVTVLQSDVRVSGLRDGVPVLLTAAHAEMDRGNGLLHLRHARYVSVGGSGGRAGGDERRTVTAEQAVAHLREGGSLERVLGEGGVTLEQGGGVLRGQRADVSMSRDGRPEVAQISGGLTYAEQGALREMEGRARQGTARFDEAGRMESAVVADCAEMKVRERAAGSLAWNERTVSGDRIEMRFARAEGGRQWLREGTATGGARLLLVDRAAKSAGGYGERTSELRGDSLVGRMEWEGGAARLRSVSGSGHTVLQRVDATGGEDTSSGETLEVSFAGAGKGVAGVGGGAVSQAVQRGGVTVTRVPGRRAGGGAPAPSLRATAGLATYEGEGEALTLRGQAEVTEGDSLLRAETVTLHQATGDAAAEGGVRASYRQAGSAEPLHVSAARAEFQRGAGRAVFFGAGGTPARLWQGASQVGAPVIEFREAEKVLTASAEGAGEVVRTVLAGGGGRRGAPEVMRVRSRSLRYSDAQRKAEFGGGVVLEDADGSLRAPEVVAQLKPTGSGGAGEGAGGAGQARFMGGSVERVTADGGVAVSQQGRRATGERLVYTAADGMFEMTGTATAAPRVVDEEQGTVTGAALRFHAGDNSVMVVGDERGGEGRRVRTETPVRQR